MALSQIQCLDENHVNPRTNESKPEFLYCEDQRLALETLLRDGREAFAKHLDARGLRGFLSDPELEALTGTVELYNPDSELFPGNAEDDEPPLSLHYWPELSDTSVPQMDLGWPDSESYRGVTRTTVYAQPPLDGQAHIKEVVRKMIAQAQKVIAVVMDVFTDVDIFRDLLDAGFKRRVSVYILLERTTLPHFLSMCQRANMHAGHLKHLRVRCTEGTEFYTRSCTKVKGRMGHRFMFIDGDKTVSGSYSFTWMSSRLDRNLITVVTGQAVEAFDRLFRFLYVTSSYVGLRHVATQPEPEPEPLPQPAAVVPPSAAIARKLYNPKYALVAASSPSPSPSAGDNGPTEPQNLEKFKNPDVPETNRRRQKRTSKETIQDAPPLHPGLSDLEKVCLFEYLPTWPEPDPPSDVIGFINIRDANRPTQVHLQRSEMFETSQAIRFSSPVSMPKETLPEVAKPRQFAAAHKEMVKPKPVRNTIKAGESVVDSVQPTQRDGEPGFIRPEEEATEEKTQPAPVNDTTKVLTADNKLHLNTPTFKDPHCSTTFHCDADAPPESSSKASTPSNQAPSYSTTNSSKPEFPPGSKSKTEAETQQSVVHRTESVEPNSTQNLLATKQRPTGLPLQSSHTKAVDTQPQNSSEMTPTVHGHTSTPILENNHIPITNTTVCTNASAPLSPIVSSSISPPASSTPLPTPLPSSTASSTLTPTPPVPKPRTFQLIIKDGDTGDAQNLPEIIRRTESLGSAGQLEVQSKADVANVVQTPQGQEPELHNSKIGEQRDTENTGNLKEVPQQQQSVASQETKDKEAVELHDNRAETQTQSDVLITDPLKTDGVNKQEITEEDPKSLILADCKITQPDQRDTKAPEETLTGCDFSPPKMNPHNNGGLQSVNSFKASTPPLVSGTTNSHKDGDDSSKDNHKGKPSVTSAPHTDSKPDVEKHNVRINAMSQEVQQTPKPRGNSHTPERPLRLHLSDTHVRDLRSLTPERELRSITSPKRTPTPDGFPSHTPSPDSRSNTPDFQILAPDISDGCVSPRDDSTVSTTSEEYYECSDSPFHDPVFDGVGRNHGITENHCSFTQANTPDATAITSTSAPYINNSTATLSTAERNYCSSEKKSLSVIVSPSLVEKMVRLREEGETVNEENGREEDEKGRKQTVADGRAEADDSQGTEKRGNEEANKIDHLKQGRDLMEIVEKDTPQTPKRKRPLNKSATENVVDGRVTKEGVDPKRLSAEGILKPDNVSSEAESPGKVMVDKAALRPSDEDKRDGHKPVDPRPWRTHQLNQAQGKVLHSSALLVDNTSAPCQPPSRPSPPQAVAAVGSSAGQKQVKFHHNQQNLSVQPPPAHRKTKVGPSQNQHAYLKPRPSFFLTHSNMHSQGRPHSHSQTVSEHGARSQEERTSPFTITFGRLYNLQGLKDKVSRVPAQSKRGSTS